MQRLVDAWMSFPGLLTIMTVIGQGIPQIIGMGTAGGIVILLLVLVSIFADSLAPYRYEEIHLRDRLQAPTAAYLLGTDHVGRDLLSRLIHGARLSLTVGLAATVLTLLPRPPGAILRLGGGLSVGISGASGQARVKPGFRRTPTRARSPQPADGGLPPAICGRPYPGQPAS